MKSGLMKKPATSKRSNNFVPGSKIPVDYLLDYLAEGYTIGDFTSAYPWIKKSDARRALKNIKKLSKNPQYVSI